MQTREQWLDAAVAAIRARIPEVASRIRCAPGFPRTFTRSGTTAEVIPDTDSQDGHFEVLIAPTLADPEGVFTALLGQVLHTLPGALTVASRAYRDALVNWGLAIEGAEVSPTADFPDHWQADIDSLGPYPHAAVTVATRKTQSTRMLKLTCPQCGYIVRTTGKWLAQGLPVCHDGAQFVAESTEGGEE